MTSPLATIALAATAFLSTNVDDTVLLLGLYANPGVRRRDVVVGQYLGMAAIVLLSLAAGRLAMTLSPRAVAMLGVAPVLMGAAQLWDAWRRGDRAGDSPGRGAASSLAVAVLTLAGGGDNIALYAPLLAGRSGGEIALICAVFAILLALWCVAARWLVGHRPARRLVTRWGSRLAPFLLIAPGAVILFRGAHGSP